MPSLEWGYSINILIFNLESLDKRNAVAIFLNHTKIGNNHSTKFLDILDSLNHPSSRYCCIKAETYTYSKQKIIKSSTQLSLQLITFFQYFFSSELYPLSIRKNGNSIENTINEALYKVKNDRSTRFFIVDKSTTGRFRANNESGFQCMILEQSRKTKRLKTFILASQQTQGEQSCEKQNLQRLPLAS